MAATPAHPGFRQRRGRTGAVAGFAAAAVLGSLLAACGGSGWKPSGLAGPFRAAPNTAYVIDGSDRVEVDGVVRLLRTLGINPQVVKDVNPAEVGHAIVWIPESSRDDRRVDTHVITALRKGARVVMAGPSDAAVQTGLSFGPTQVELTGERYAAQPDLKVVWTHPRRTWAVHDARNDYVAATSPDGKNPIAISGSFGEGSFLWMAVGAGTGAAERFPLLPLMLRDLMGQGPSPLWRQGIDLYVDPGTLHGQDPTKLADKWVSEGVRRVYIAAWEFGFQTGDAPYDEYVAAAHSHGIAAYAWLEPPVVNDAFYNSHPECHEKTASGRDAVGDWRKLVALEDPACFAGAVDAYRQVLSAHDWDGVNIAELYFEDPLSGPKLPNLYTPMSSWVRSDFASRFGFDPAALFDPRSQRYFKKSPASLKTFTTYRQDLITDLHRRLVTALGTQLAVVVTTIDDKLSPSTAKNVGVDVSALQKLAATQHFQLQYEDPFTAWTQGPRRYDVAHTLYPAGAVFDINDVARPGGRPTSVPTGSELLVTVDAAAGQAGEIALYGEGTVPALDSGWLPGALAAAASWSPRAGSGAPAQVVEVDTPFTIRVPGPPGTKSATLDGKPWPLVDAQGRALVTAGKHVVAFSPSPANGLGAESCSCEISVVRTDGPAVLVYYTSPSRVWLVVDGVPEKITVDGKPMPAAPVPGGVVVELPAGGHTFVAS